MNLRGRHDSGGIAPMDLIGREAEIERLRLFLSQIATGAGDALLLSGDPGVGKTSLLGVAAALAADSGIRLLRATGSQFEADISYAALHQLLRPCLDEVPELSPMLAGALNVALDLGVGPPPAQLLVATAVLALLQNGGQGTAAAARHRRPAVAGPGQRARARHGRPPSRRPAGRPAGGLPDREPNFFEQGNLPVALVAPLSDEAATELLASATR